MLKKIDSKLISELLKKARSSERKRTNYNLHKEDEVLQRMVNAALKGSYFAPHKHEAKDKCELFCILEGKAAIVTFNDKGDIKDHFIIDARSKNKLVEIQPNTWHTIIILSRYAVLFEVIYGKYNPKTHKTFAPFAPKEGDKDAQAYLNNLINSIKE